MSTASSLDSYNAVPLSRGYLPTELGISHLTIGCARATDAKPTGQQPHLTIGCARATDAKLKTTPNLRVCAGNRCQATNAEAT